MDTKLTVENVHALSSGTVTRGILKLTAFHIIFSAPVPSSPPKEVPADSLEASTSSLEASKPKPQLPSSPAVRYRESWITYPIIAHCTFRPTPSTSGVPSSIRIRCRDFNIVCFNFFDDKQAREVFEFIRHRTCRLTSIEKLYAFSYVPARQEKDLYGWHLYDARAEFRRQGISEKLSDKGWRISAINKDYAFSPTYPALLVVPSKISDNVLKYAGQFRSRARIPALTYYHPITQCSITRSSQPLVGVRNNRSIQDERLVSACFYKSTAIFSSDNPTSNIDVDGSSSLGDSGSGDTMIVSYDGTTSTVSESPPPDRGGDSASEADDGSDGKPGSRLVGARRDNLIVDARPAINSLAMQVVGKGSENMDYYKSAKKMFLSIDNIHVMRDSLNKVIEAVKDADVSPLPPNQDLLAKSGWLKHIRCILAGSQTIARQVGVSAAHVLIHCSDGWDRTSQLSGLSQIMLDPYFRTIDGFIILVEKDWLSFGHMFQQRSGYLNSEKWFVTQNDAMAGTKIDPSESDGRNFDHAVASARRFFKKSLSQDKDESDGDGAAATGEDANNDNQPGPVEEGQATRPKEISPVFHQFLDATYQLLRQHPARFEFNERFLRRLLYHLYSCQYGTFLYNSECQRRDAKVSEKTSSVWDYFLSRRAEFLNSKYDASIDANDRQVDCLLFPKLDEVRWWHQAFNRTDQDMNAPLHAAAATAERSANYQAAAMASVPAEPAAVVATPSEDDGAVGHAETSARSSPSIFAHRWAKSVAPPLSQPPSLANSQSVAAEIEPTAASASSIITTPNASIARLMLATPVEASTESLRRSSSANETGAFATLRDGIAGLGLGQKMGDVLGTLGTVGSNNFGIGGGAAGSRGKKPGSGNSTSNISGREALFGVPEDDSSAAGKAGPGGVFDSFIGGGGGGGSRHSKANSRSSDEQEFQDK
ncbi:phosphatidylinositol-3-phosphatase ymr1 [Sporothrix epigloea]|uniref:Phosphatidylinositol-3-phosphatase ymr1 n=1 Tax=Sporothrix epigloea TaxID=1892477 RepID=A0ABP0DYJ5_9PEZI